MPFADPDRLGLAATRGARFTYGPLLRYFRDRRMSAKYEREPAWRRRTPELVTGHERRW
jgi:hypothetical protein